MNEFKFREINILEQVVIYRNGIANWPNLLQWHMRVFPGRRMALIKCIVYGGVYLPCGEVTAYLKDCDIGP